MSPPPEWDDIPRLDEVPEVPERFLRRARPWAERLLRFPFRVHLHGTDFVPVRGPVIFASNHIGVLDGPLLAAFSPRPVHALTKEEMFEGRAGSLLKWAGQVPLDRRHADPSAVKTCLRLLVEGRAVGIYPEGTRGDGELETFHAGAAYLALATGAPVIPVATFGTRPPGGGTNALPRRGDRIDLVYGEATRLNRVAWPRRREQVGESSALLHERMREHLAHAKDLTGRHLPGPIAQLSSGDTR